MSQAKIIPTARVHSFPPLAYKNVPVLTTEMLAQAYEVEAKQIRQNFANNKKRFIEGKHFFSVSGQELKNFLLRVENFDSQLSPKVRVLTLWTDRGAARHAKSLNTDRAWDMYELLEETFFHVVKPELLENSEQLPDASRLSTPASRKPLEKLVKVWARQGGLIHAQCWTMLNAAFNLQCISDLPEEWIPDAITWVQSRIDALPKALPAAEPDYALTPAQAKFVPGDLSVFVKEVETSINSMTYLVNRMELFGHPSGLTWGQISRNKALLEAVVENIQSARAACVAGLRMLKSVKLICAGVR